MFWLGSWWSSVSQDHLFIMWPKKSCQKPPAFHSLSLQDISGTCQQWPSEASKALWWVCRTWLPFQKMEQARERGRERDKGEIDAKSSKAFEIPKVSDEKAGLQLNLNSVPKWILDSECAAEIQPQFHNHPKSLYDHSKSMSTYAPAYVNSKNSLRLELMFCHLRFICTHILCLVQ